MKNPETFDRQKYWIAEVSSSDATVRRSEPIYLYRHSVDGCTPACGRAR